ncbi:hypothetical protein GCM10023108_02320 [Saccharopolyspora hordei]
MVLDLITSPATAGLLAAAVLVAVFPLRGGHGQHAGAGPGTLTVRQVREAVRPDPVDVFATMTEQECQAYLDERTRRKLAAVPPPYVGKHRLAIEDLVDEFHPRVAVALHPRVLQHGLWW